MKLLKDQISNPYATDYIHNICNRILWPNYSKLFTILFYGQFCNMCVTGTVRGLKDHVTFLLGMNLISYTQTTWQQAMPYKR